MRFILRYFILLVMVITVSISAADKKKKTDRGAEDKELTGKVELQQDRHKFTNYYYIGKYQVSKSCHPKVEELEGKKVKAKVSIHKGIILKIYEIEELDAPAKDNKDEKKDKK